MVTLESARSKTTTTSTIIKSRNVKSPVPPTNFYLLLAVKIGIIILILLWLAPLVTGGRYSFTTKRRRYRTNVQMQRMRNQCNTETVCAQLIPEESLNCSNQCISTKCYAEIYATNPLEDGEVDLIRGQIFEECVRNEVRRSVAATA